MTNKTILDLPLVTTLDGSEYFETVQAGVSVRVAGDVLASLAPTYIGISQTASTSYTFILVDAGTQVQFTSGSSVAATIPPNSSVAFAEGAAILIEQNGAGVVTLIAGVGVTINSNGGKVATNGQYAVASILKVDTNTWTLSGNLT